MKSSLAAWNDGSSLRRDPRGEDPLYYYLSGDDWSGAIGFEILPLWEERCAQRVEIMLRAEDRPRLKSLSDERQTEIYSRTVPSIVKQFPHWQQVTLRFPSPERALDNRDLEAKMEGLGFSLMPSVASDERVWLRE